MISEYDLFEAMNGAKDADLLHAERKARRPASRAILRTVSLAACACLVIIIAGVSLMPHKDAPDAPDVPDAPGTPSVSQQEISVREEATPDGPEKQTDTPLPAIIWNEANYNAPEEELAYPEGTFPFSYQGLTADQVAAILGSETRTIIGGENAICQAIYAANGDLFEVELGFAEGTYVLDLYLVEPVIVGHPPLTDEATSINGTDFVCWLVEDGKQFGEVTSLTLLARGRLGSVEVTVVRRNVEPDDLATAEAQFAAILQSLAKSGEPNLTFLGYRTQAIHWNQTSADVPLTLAPNGWDSQLRSRFLTQGEKDLLLPENSDLDMVRGLAQYTLGGQLVGLTLYCYLDDVVSLDVEGVGEVSPVLTVDPLGSMETGYPPDSRTMSIINGQDVLLWRHQREETEAVYHHLFAAAQLDGQAVNFELHFSQDPTHWKDDSLLDFCKTYFLHAVAAYLTYGSGSYANIAAASDTALVWSPIDPDAPMVNILLPEGASFGDPSPELLEAILLDMPDCVTGLRSSNAIFDQEGQLLSLTLSLNIEGINQEMIFTYGNYYVPITRPKDKIPFSMGDVEVCCWLNHRTELDEYSLYASLEGRNEHLFIADVPGEAYSTAETAFAEVLNAFAKNADARSYTVFPTFSGTPSTPMLDRFIRHMEDFAAAKDNQNQMDEYFIQLEPGLGEVYNEPTFGPQQYIMSQSMGSGASFGGEGELSREEQRQHFLDIRQGLPGILFVLEKTEENMALPEDYPTFALSDLTAELLEAQTVYQDSIPEIRLSILLNDVLLTVRTYDCTPEDLARILEVVAA